MSVNYYLWVLASIIKKILFVSFVILRQCVFWRSCSRSVHANSLDSNAGCECQKRMFAGKPKRHDDDLKLLHTHDYTRIFSRYVSSPCSHVLPSASYAKFTITSCNFKVGLCLDICINPVSECIWISQLYKFKVCMFPSSLLIFQYKFISLKYWVDRALLK